MSQVHGLILTHRKQHFVPRSYLSAWCDAATPTGQTPYVWTFPKEGGVGRPRAPRNLFTETDMYSIRTPDGSRDLSLEHGLAGMESEFTRVARDTLANLRPLSSDEHLAVCGFAAAMQVRVAKQRDHFGEIWSAVLEDLDVLKRKMESKTPAERAAIRKPPLPPSSRRSSLSYDDVKSLAEQPLQNLLAPAIEVQLPGLLEMDLAVLQTENEIGFITSDAPCVWFDPEAEARPFPFNAVGLMYPTLEITLPISPKQLLLFSRSGISGYATVTDQGLDELNRRTLRYADEFIVVNQNRTHPNWYVAQPRNE